MKTEAPDGGLWGWLAVFACFMGNLIGDGIMYSFGVFLPYFKEHFNAGSGEISTVNSIQMGVTFASGPIASWMTNKFGWRITTVIGSILGTAGLCLSAVAPNIPFLIFSAGGLLGLGLGIIYLPRLDCITQYFDKKRPFVTGLAICGSGIGTFIFAPLTEVLLTNAEGDWQSVLHLLGAICALNCFFGLLFKPLPRCMETDDSFIIEKMGEEQTNKDGLLQQEDMGDGLLNKKAEVCVEEKETFKEMFALLRDWAFMMFAISNFLTSLGYPIPYTFVPDNAQKLGLTAVQGSYLVGLIGISNTVARLVLGLLSQRVDRLFLYNTCLVICGITMAFSNYFQPATAAIFGHNCADLASLNELANASIASDLSASSMSSITSDLVNATLASGGCPTVPVSNVSLSLSWACDPYIGQLIYVNCYGVTSAAYVLLTTLVLADLLGADKFTNSFGLLLLFQGVATFVGPPVVGFLFDAYCSYNSGFLLMGAMIALSGAMLYPIPCIRNALSEDLELHRGAEPLRQDVAEPQV